ncbi:MAG TPA: hypothetical protein DIW24_03200 [Bacteroidetes bacterium]|nr:hypothetical protein [Bacteroidota bacterium]HRR09583.1 hypothetical protein [Rhodothermales bacterium]
MKKIFTFFLLSFVLGASAAFAQDVAVTDAKSLLEAAYNKSGGTKWENVLTLTRQGTLTIIGTEIGDLDGTISQANKFPTHSVVSQEIGTPMGMMSIKNVVTPEKAWMDHSFSGRQEIPNDEANIEKNASPEKNLLNDTETTYTFAEGTLDNQAVYVLTYTKKDNTHTRYYDKTSLLCLANKVESENGTSTQYFVNRMDKDGLLFVSEIKIVQNMGGNEMTIKVKYDEISVNPTLSDDLFSDK